MNNKINNKTKTDKKYLKQVLKYFLKHKKELTIMIIITLIKMSISIIEPFITAKEYSSIANIDIQNIIKYTIIIFIISIVSNILMTISSLIGEKYSKKIEIDVQKDITKELFKLEIKNFDKKGTDFFIERAISDTKSLIINIGYIRHEIIYTIASFGVIFYIINASFKLFILLIISSFILLYIDKKSRDIYEKNYKTRREIRENQNSTFTELIRGIRDIKVLNLRKNMTDKIIKGQEIVNTTKYKENKEQEIYRILYSLCRQLITVIIILYSLYLLSNKEIDGSLLLVIYLYHNRVINLTNTIGSLYKGIKEINLNMMNIQDILNNPDYPKEKFGTKTKEYFDGNIMFKNVSFKYDELPVLKNINFEIKPNSTIGFVGKSGSGKTTIFNLISKLYTIEEGEILIDNQNINDYSESTIRGNISVITQEPYIFNMSIKENIKIVKPSITDEELIEKCKLAEIHDYIETLPNKYDTIVGENGVILSGGLKQRLSIARALVKKSEIILLDEATSALDNELQESVMKAIKNINKDYTILIIAHRLSTIKDCDKIIVIDDGEIKGYDTHDKLIEENEIYQRLYKKELIK